MIKNKNKNKNKNKSLDEEIINDSRNGKKTSYILQAQYRLEIISEICV